MKQRKRPIIIEFTGTPYSVKTQVIEILDRHLRRKDLKIMVVPESANLIRVFDRKKYISEVRLFLLNLTNLLDIINENRFDIAFFDRGIVDSFFWAIFRHKKDKKLTQNKLNKISSFILFEDWMNEIDLIFNLICDPEEAFLRKEKITLEKNNIKSPFDDKNFYLELHSIFSNQHEALGFIQDKLITINTTNLNKKEVALKIISYIEKFL